MELDQLLGLECSGEHLVSLYVLVEDLVPCGIGAPGTIEGGLGVNADQMRWDIDIILSGHEVFDQCCIPSCSLE